MYPGTVYIMCDIYHISYVKCLMCYVGRLFTFSPDTIGNGDKWKFDAPRTSN